MLLFQSREAFHQLVDAETGFVPGKGFFLSVQGFIVDKTAGTNGFNDQRSLPFCGINAIFIVNVKNNLTFTIQWGGTGRIRVL